MRIGGTNGSGKTSLLKILAGINSAETGEITLDNQACQSDEYQQEIFYLGHLSALSQELTSLENLSYLCALNQSHVQTDELVSHLATMDLKGYEHERCGNLSAGQKRRVVLAALFASKAKLWLLDEPFTALDPKGVEIVENGIRDHIQNGGMCLFTTHQDSSLEDQRLLTLWIFICIP